MLEIGPAEWNGESCMRFEKIPNINKYRFWLDLIRNTGSLITSETRLFSQLYYL